MNKLYYRDRNLTIVVLMIIVLVPIAILLISSADTYETDFQRLLIVATLDLILLPILVFLIILMHRRKKSGYYNSVKGR